MNTVPGPILRIGDLRVDPALDEICKDGKIIKIEPRTMRLLLCLAHRPGQVLSVEQLLDEVWKDVVVSPDSVYQAIAALRRLLGDDPKEPKYIANVLRRGYRLVAPVAPWVDEPPVAAVATLDAPVPGAAPATRGPPNAASARSPAPVAIAAMLAIALGMVAVKFWPSERNASPPPATVPNLLPDKSVAVLPFSDLSDKKDQAYFADGLAEEIIDLLTKVPGLHVPARASSFYFKGKQASIADIARSLAVRYLLEGSVRRSADELRVTAALVRADDGLQLWSDIYERPASEVFKTQDDIAREVSRVLNAVLPGHGAQRIAPTTSPEAYSLYLQALARDHLGGDQDYDDAAEYLRRAVALDPKFALAWAMLGTVLIDDLNWHSSNNILDPCVPARQAVNEALRLDPSLSRAHSAKADVLSSCDRDPKAAEVEIKRALAIDPDDAGLWRGYASIAYDLKQSALQLRLAQESVIRDPLNAWAYDWLAAAQNNNGLFAAAEGSYRRAVELEPQVKGLHAEHANQLLLVKQPAAALAEAQKEIDEQFRLMTVPFALDALGRTADADRAIAEFEQKYSGRDPLSLAEFYACRHDADRAIMWLRRQDPPVGHDMLNRDACFRNIDGDPRYRALQSKLWPK